MKPRVTSLSIAAGLAAHALFACSADDAALGKLDATSIAPSDSFQAYSLARVKDGDGEIEDLVVSDDYVFFIAFWQGIYRMPKYGGDVELIEQSRKANIIALAANHEQVFWQRFAGSDEQSHFDLHLQAIAGGAQRDVERSLPVFRTKLLEYLTRGCGTRIHDLARFRDSAADRWGRTRTVRHAGADA